MTVIRRATAADVPAIAAIYDHVIATSDAIWEDGVMHLGEERGVWFRDPDGNTISVETH